jgi:AcrR family transcriptional regulator
MAHARRDHLVDTALALFQREGYHATGIDRILGEAGVAKMTLYNHFKSKDELILAALRLRDERFRNWFMRDVERRTKDPCARLLACFDALADWFAQPDFRGCTFINAAAEFGQPGSPIHAACAEHKRLVAGYVRDLAEAVGATDPQGLADGLVLLMEGAIVMAYVADDAEAAANAKRAAEVLIGHGLD